MAEMQLTVEAVPAVALIQELATGCRVDLSFELHNGSASELELVAIEQDAYDADGSLLLRRTLDADGRIGPGERRTLENPLPEFSRGIPLVALVYRFAFRASDGGLLRAVVEVRALELAVTAQLEPAAAPGGRAAASESEPVAPTPRQLTRAWFEALCELGVYSLPAPAHP